MVINEDRYEHIEKYYELTLRGRETLQWEKLAKLETLIEKEGWKRAQFPYMNRWEQITAFLDSAISSAKLNDGRKLRVWDFARKKLIHLLRFRIEYVASITFSLSNPLQIYFKLQNSNQNKQVSCSDAMKMDAPPLLINFNMIQRPQTPLHRAATPPNGYQSRGIGFPRTNPTDTTSTDFRARIPPMPPLQREVGNSRRLTQATGSNLINMSVGQGNSGAVNINMS